MRAVTLVEPKNLLIKDVPIPELLPDELLFRVEATSMCSTDLMVYQGHYGTSLPVIPGHEAAGVVEKVGSNVTSRRPGDRVVIEASWGCGSCAFCLRGLTDQCPARVALGRSRDGTYVEYIVAPARAFHPIPDGVTFGHASAMATVACGVRAMRRGRPGFGENVAIFGPGISGLVLMQLVVRNGAARTVMLGTRDWRLDLALRQGATGAVNVRREGWEERARELAGEGGFDLIFEVTGTPGGLLDAMNLVRTGGRVVSFSLYSGPIDGFPAQALYSKEITLLGSRGSAGGFPLAIELVDSGHVKLDELISHTLPLEDAEKGFDMMAGREEGMVRVSLVP